jgi:gliding motility-associated-like protein
MRKIILLSIAVLFTFTAFSQDFSNKGKEFWLCFPSHVPSSNNATLSIWITSDQASSGTVTMTNGAFSGTFNIVAGGIQEIQILWAANTHITNAESGAIIQKSIKVAVDAGKPPVVAYVQQWGAARSAATLLLPTNVLGKKYYATSFTQSGTGASKSQFQIIATQPNTNVTITPRWNGVLQTPITVNFPNVGDMYQYQADQDITGSLIESIAGGGGTCSPIAVFSGSSALTMSIVGCTGGQSSYDPLFQQAYPVSSWGKNFGFIPFGDYTNGNPYRIMASENNTTVSMNGAVVATLNAGEIYPAAFTSNPVVITTPTSITADRPISVAQYAQRRDCSGTSNGDPDMVLLNPIEQNIKDITVFASTQQNISRQWINVLIPTSKASTFKINGVVPSTAFIPSVNIAGYSTLTHLFNPTVNGPKVLTADTGFNAIMYGFQGGQFESYAYSAGTNVRDLNTKLEINNPNTDPSETEPTACTGSPFRFKVYFADSTTNLTALRYDSIQWEVLNNASNFVPNNFPVMIRPTPPDLTVTPDSVNTRNGKYVAWYSLPTLYTVTAPGVYRIRITLFRTSNEGCGNFVEYEFDLTVSDPPTASFTPTVPGCYLEPLVLTETTPQIPKATYKWWWEVTELAPGPIITTVYTSRNVPSHIFTRPGNKLIRHASITTPGCISDTIPQTITVPDIPTATLSGSTTVCINAANPQLAVNFFDGRAPWRFRYSINGTNQPDIVTSSNPYLISAATGVANTFIYKLEEVRNDGSTVCVSTPLNQTHTVTVQPDATVTLTTANNNQTRCINNNISPIRHTIGGTYTSVTVNGLPSGVTYTVVGNEVIITGAPTTVVGSPFTYTIDPVGPCLVPNPPVGGTITVDNDATIALQTANNNQTRCINTAIGDIDYLVGGGGTGATIAWTPSLPTGITFTPLGGNQFRIGGASSVTGTFTYTISTTGPCIKPTATGTLIIQPDATVTLRAGDNASPTVCVNNAIPNIRHDLGGTFTGATLGGTLPPGVNFNVVGSVVTISGTPTAPGVYAYQVVPTSVCAVPIPPVGGTITVNDDATIALQTGNNNQTRCINTLIGDIDYLVGGGGTGATIAWTPSLPTGITFTPLGGNRFRIGGASSVTGTFNYTISTTGPCIKPTATGTLIIQPDATVTLRAGDNANPTVCVNNAIPTIRFDLGGTFTGASVAGLPIGVTFSVVGSVVTISGTPTLAGSYSYVVVPASVCAVPNPQVGGTITVTGDATVTLNAGSNNNQTVCRNTAITDIDYTIGGTATGLNISWVPAAPTGINFATLGGNQFRISGTPTVVGTQTYTYTLSTTGPCVVPNVTGTITVNALPVASFTPQAIRCANSVITFTNTSTPNAGGNTDYTWDFGDPNANAGNPNTATTNTASPNTSHFYIVPNTSPGYTVTLTATNSNGCISNPIASIIVPVNDTPRAGFIVPEVCINDVATVFTDTSRINAGNTITGWQWNYGDPAGGPYTHTTQNGVHLYPAPGIYQVDHVAISNAGCRDTIRQPITINSADPVSNYDFVNRNTLCSSDSVQLRNLSTVGFGNVTKLEIYWDVTGAPGVFETVNDPVFNGIIKHKYLTNLQTSTTYNIRVVAYSGNVCFTSRPDAITVHATPIVQFNNMAPSCLLIPPFQITQGSEIGGVPGVGTYSGPGITNPNGTFNPQIAGVGTHPIKYTFTASNAGACIDTLTRFITVIDTASAIFSHVSPTCDGDAVTFREESTAPAGVVLANTIWDFGHPGPTESHAPGTTFTHVFPGIGNYTVTMYNVSAAGCRSNPRSQNIFISPIPQPSWTVDKTAYCLPSDALVKFTNNSTLFGGGLSDMTYLWEFDDPNDATTASGLNATHNYTSIGPFNVKLTATATASGCKKSRIIPLTTVHPQPKARFKPNKPEICIEDVVTFTDESDPKDGTTVGRYWDPEGDGSFLPENRTSTYTHLYPTAKAYAPTLYIVNSFGCHSDTLPQPFIVNPYPVFNAGKDRTILEFGSVTLDPEITSGENLQYLWTPNIYFSNNNKIKKPTASLVKDDITYTLLLTSQGGCSKTSTVKIKVLKFPQIPNTFTPNNDGINDKWVIEYLNSYPNCRVQVFTRTGQLVFESKGYGTPWDGTMKGKPLPFDTYYYVIEPQAGRDPVTGYVTIVK